MRLARTLHKKGITIPEGFAYRMVVTAAEHELVAVVAETAVTARSLFRVPAGPAAQTLMRGLQHLEQGLHIRADASAVGCATGDVVKQDERRLKRVTAVRVQAPVPVELPVHGLDRIGTGREQRLLPFAKVSGHSGRFR